MGNGHAHSGGFSLIELLVSSVILGLSLVALSQLYMSAMWTYQKARKLSIATNRAQFELEKVDNLGYEGLITGVNSGNPTIEDAYFPSEYTYLSSKMGVAFTIPDLPNGQGTVSWQPYPSNTSLSSCKILQATIDIQWDGSPKAQSRVHLITLCAMGYK